MSEISVTRENLVSLICSSLNREAMIYREFLSNDAIQMGNILSQIVTQTNQMLTLNEVDEMDKCLDHDNHYASVWWYSVWLVNSKEPIVFERMLRYILDHNEAFSGNTLLYYYNYLSAKIFVMPNIISTHIMEPTIKLADIINQRFTNEIGEVEPLPYPERNKNLIIILTGQFLNEKHAPTLYLLNYAVALQDLGYTVEIINTGKVLSEVGKSPLYDALVPNYIIDFTGVHLFEWQGHRMKLTQYELQTPDVVIVNDIMAYVRQVKPVLAIHIGGGVDVASHLVNKMIPVIGMSMGVALPISRLAYRAVISDHGLSDDDIALLHYQKMSEDCAITYPDPMILLSPEKSDVTRVNINIDANDFVLVVVGNRLDKELDPAFLQMLDNVLTDNMIVMFIGEFAYNDKVENYPHLKQQSRNLGYRNDLMSCIKLANLFVNPKRSGGGTGGKIALMAKVPVVTMPKCDVGTIVGADFHVRDYAEMQETIIRYVNDEKFYKERVIKAEERIQQLPNMRDTMKYLIDEVLRREQKNDSF